MWLVRRTRQAEGPLQVFIMEITRANLNLGTKLFLIYAEWIGEGRIRKLVR